MVKNKDEKDERLVYTPEETRKLLGVSRAVIYSLLAKKSIPCIRAGRKYLIPKHQFNVWLGESSSNHLSPDGDE